MPRTVFASTLSPLTVIGIVILGVLFGCGAIDTLHAPPNLPYPNLLAPSCFPPSAETSWDFVLVLWRSAKVVLIRLCVDAHSPFRSTPRTQLSSFRPHQ
ncbi:hypothetical protein C8Q74DRAFT_1374165 [Fomes fomentarius]|nr:hypothetical protein C8Q74DRAFT_1374147 [Fomes fomentarius]KAI0749068.1 hypothetical protein C8Q74DRAFT_1374165 [Fomes fomentarius]